MNKALLQWAILMSISAIGALVYHEVVKKKLKNKRIDSLKEKNKTSETKLPSTDEEPTSSVLNLGQEEATLATTKYKQGLYEDAIKFYTKAIHQSQLPKIIDYKNLKIMFSNRAAAYEKLQDHHNVIKDCTSALELDSRHSKSYLRRAKAKSFLLDFAGALGDYVCMVVICDEKKEQLDPNIASEIDRLHSELTMQAIEDARQNKKSSLRYLPPDFFITSYFSTFHPSDDDSKITVDASVDVYTVEINSLNAPDHSSPQKGLLLVKRALAKNAKQDYEGAAIDFDSSLQYLRPGNEGYYISQLSNGTFHHLRGNFSKAEDCFKHALKENPSSIFAQVRLGGISFDKKETLEAIAWFDKALASKGDSPTALFHRGQLRSVDGDISLAIKDLERCVEISPDFAMAYVQLGVSHARGGNIDRAIELLEKASQISPTLPDIYNYLGETYIQKLQIPGSGIDLKTVEDMFNKATSLDPTYPMAYINKGNILLQMGNSPNEAIELFKKAVQMAPRSKFAYSHLAQVYMVMQEYEKAIDQLDAAIEYAFSDEELKELYGLRVTTQAQMMAKKLLN